MAENPRDDLAMPMAKRNELFAMLKSIRNGTPDDVRIATLRLLETAVVAAHFVEMAWYINRKAVSEASKHYAFFPILLASGKGRDASQKRNRVDALPIGEFRPFKRIQRGARNDDVRSWIEGDFDVFQHIQRGHMHLVDPIEETLVQTIRSLPELSKATARQWAAIMVERKLKGRGGDTFIHAIGIDTSKATQKRRHKKVAIIRKQFGGTRLRLVKDGVATRFFVGKSELDFEEATLLEKRMRDAQLLKENTADKLEALVDTVEKRLISILK